MDRRVIVGAVELFGKEGLRREVVASHLNEFTDAALPCRRSLAIEHEVNCFSSLRTNEAVIDVRSRTEREIGQSAERIPRRFRVQRW